MDLNDSNVVNLPSQETMEIGSSTKGENTHNSQDTYESNSIVKVTGSVTPLGADDRVTESHILLQTEIFSKSVECESNFKSDANDINNSFAHDMLNVLILEENGNNLGTNTVGEFEINDYQTRFQSTDQTPSQLTSIQNNQYQSNYPFKGYTQNETTICTKEEINVTYSVSNSTNNCLLYTDEIANKNTEQCDLKGTETTTNCKDLVPFPNGKGNFYDSLKKSSNNMFEKSKLSFDKNLLGGLTLHKNMLVVGTENHVRGIWSPILYHALTSNGSKMDCLESYQKNNTNVKTPDVVNTCKALVPYRPLWDYWNLERDQNAEIMPLLYNLVETIVMQEALEHSRPITDVSNVDNAGSLNLLLQKIYFHQDVDSLVRTVKHLDQNEDVINHFSIGKGRVSQISDLEPTLAPLDDDGEKREHPFSLSYERSVEQSNINTATTDTNVNVDQLLNVNVTCTPNAESNKKRNMELNDGKISPDFDDASWSDNETLQKRIKLCIEILDRDIDGDNKDRPISNNDEGGNNGDLDEIIEHSILKYETFTADKGVSATPSTSEQSSQTASTLPDGKVDCKRRLFIDNYAHNSKKMKYFDVNDKYCALNIYEFNESSNSANSTLEENNLAHFRELGIEMTKNKILSPLGEPLRFEESVSQFFITPSATVPAFAEEEKAQDDDSEKTMFSDEDSYDHRSMNWTPESDLSREFTVDHLVPTPFIKTSGAPPMHVTPKKPILRLGLSRRARPKPLHSPSPLH